MESLFFLLYFSSYNILATLQLLRSLSSPYLMKNVVEICFLFWLSAFFVLMCLFRIWVFFHEHLQFTGQLGKEEAISLIRLYHFHALHKHLDISRGITVESLPLHIASSRTQTCIFSFRSQVANH